MRSPSSSAARLLKVTAVIVSVAMPVATNQAMRATRVVVLPLPAGATHNTGPVGAVAAARWSGASRFRRASTAECNLVVTVIGAMIGIAAYQTLTRTIYAA